MVESAEQEHKEALLAHLSLAVSMVDKKASNVKLSSLLCVKIALKLSKVATSKVEDQIFTTETSIKAGKVLGVAIWRSRHEMRKNKKKLENPNSLEDY